MVTDYWDFFCVDGICRDIWGFSFHIEAGKHLPICFKPPRYGSEVMRKLVGWLDENAVVEEYDGQ